MLSSASRSVVAMVSRSAKVTPVVLLLLCGLSQACGTDVGNEPPGDPLNEDQVVIVQRASTYWAQAITAESFGRCTCASPTASPDIDRLDSCSAQFGFPELWYGDGGTLGWISVQPTTQQCILDAFRGAGNDVYRLEFNAKFCLQTGAVRAAECFAEAPLDDQGCEECYRDGTMDRILDWSLADCVADERTNLAVYHDRIMRCFAAETPAR